MNDFSKHDFFGDFLEEATEHLRSINKNLLALEQTLSPESPLADPTTPRSVLLSELFRSFHSLKGLSGMVGLSQAEEISHTMESMLRSLQNAQIEVDQVVIDRLLNGSRAIQAIIATHSDPNTGAPDKKIHTEELSFPSKQTKSSPDRTERTPQPEETTPPYRPGYPDPDEAGLEDMLPFIHTGLSEKFPEIANSLDERELHYLQTLQVSGKVINLVLFTPAAIKSAEGFNVSRLKEKLSEAGEFVKGIPIVEGDSIRFVFIVASDQPLDPVHYPETELHSIAPGKEKQTFYQNFQEFSSIHEARPSQDNQTVSENTGAFPVTPTIRVDPERFDELMRLVSELVVCRSRLVELLPKLPRAKQDIDRPIDQMEQIIEVMERYLRDLRQVVTRARLVPLSEVFDHMQLAVRDLARGSGKDVRIEMQGENTEIDKTLVEKLLDPLLHLVRNAITHGIEAPDEREAAGKQPFGTLILRGRMEGDQVLVQVVDDGRGLKFDKIADKGRTLGLISENQTVDEGNALDLISRHGFTTLEEADLDAGRGIGMEIVLQTIHSVGGSLDLSSSVGKGTTFTIRLPVTLSIVDALIVRVGEERFAIPRYSVDEALEINPERIVKVESGELFPLRQSPIGLVKLSEIFHLPASKGLRYFYGLLISSQEQQAVLVVDQLIGLREVVVRPIKDPSITQPGIYGATELGDGKAILVLDAPTLIKLARQ